MIIIGEDGVEFGGNISQEASLNDGSTEDLIENDLFNHLLEEDTFEGRIPHNEPSFYNHPENEFLKENKEHLFELLCRWDSYEHYLLKFGFKGREDGYCRNILNYDNIDEKLCEIHVGLRCLKFGF